MTQTNFKFLDKYSVIKLNSNELHFSMDFIEVLSSEQTKALNSSLVIDKL